MKVIILVAGVSRRLVPLTLDVPKCLVPVGGRTILSRQLDALQGIDIEEVVMITGYRREQIKEAVQSGYPDLNVRFIVNQHFFDTNTAYSLGLANETFSGHDFLYFNGDVLFPAELLRRLVRSERSNPLAVEAKLCGEEEVKVIVGADDRIADIGKHIDPAVALGEFIGVARFDAALTPHLAAALDRVIADGERNAYFERALEHLAVDQPLHALDVTDLPCIEIDFPEDLAKAEELVSRLQKGGTRNG